MTTYGTISEEASSNSNSVFVSQAKERIEDGLGTTRPWSEMLQTCHLKLPSSFFGAIQRINTNAKHFRANYVIIILLVLFLSLLGHPISLIILVVMMIAWLYLYFLRDTPLVILRFEMDERLVVISLLLITIGLLVLTNVTYNVIVGMCVALVVVLVHAIMRETEDLFTMDEDVGVVKGFRDVVKVPLRQPVRSHRRRRVAGPPGPVERRSRPRRTSQVPTGAVEGIAAGRRRHTSQFSLSPPSHIASDPFATAGRSRCTTAAAVRRRRLRLCFAY
ncbi:PRA1 family protein F2 [Glycine soja]|nr:PRA1 family protein F2 [Glycine soja]